MIFLAHARQYPVHDLVASALPRLDVENAPRTRAATLENLALRQQLAVQKRSVKRPELLNLARGLWVLLCIFWADWAKVLVIVAHTREHTSMVTKSHVGLLLLPMNV